MKKDKIIEREKRIKYRKEFLKRRLTILLEEKEKLERLIDRKKINHIDPNLSQLMDIVEGMEEVAYFLENPAEGLSTVGILDLEASDNSGISPLDYDEIKLAPKEMEQDDDNLLINRVVENYNIIPIIINLNGKRDDIIKDIRYLLRILQREAKVLGRELGIQKNPRWDLYDEYLDVYDQKKKNPKLTWSDIAKSKYPKEIFKNISPHRKILRESITTSAKDSVRDYWKQANFYINKGGWKFV